MTTFKVGDGTDDAVLFVTLPLVVPDWFRVAFMGALREMTIEDNWFVEGDSTANFARDKAVEMINGIEFSEVNPLPMYTPPIGSMMYYPVGDSAPAGWMTCHGQVLASADYPELFALIGTAYGGGGGNFLLPDLRGRFLVVAHALATGYEVGDTGGAESVTLTEAEMPAHTHTQFGFAAGATTPVQNIAGARTGSNTAVNATGSKGGGEPHENRPPYMAMEMIMYVGIV